jgi:hypothetical protein
LITPIQGFKNRFRINIPLIFYVLVLCTELVVINAVSDLPTSLSNWLSKSREIAGLGIPEDNFYGPGAAILLVPFTLIPDKLFLANLFYFGLGTIAFWKISMLIPNTKLKYVSALALPLNFYLIWLVNSSQDTVFEFFLLSWSIYFLIKRRYLLFAGFAFLLCETRAGYWVFFLVTSIVIFCVDKLKRKPLVWKKIVAVPLLIFTSIFNFTNYESPSPALEGGVTLYFSYTKYHYLSLPKMDMDVFLSGPKGPFSESFTPNIPEDSTPAEVNTIYGKAGIRSALENPKETTLGWMQKFDSYFFDVQKIPHLPGAYVFDQEKMVIEIQNERLTWPLVLGNLLYMVWRSFLVLFGLIGLGLVLASNYFKMSSSKLSLKLWPLALPYLIGFVPGILIYTETRFKIVSEMLLVPLIVEIFAITITQRKASLRK